MRNKCSGTLKEKRKLARGDSKVNLDTITIQALHDIISELRLQQMELRIQNEDLIKAQTHLEGSCEKYARLFEFAPVSYFILNESSLIQDVNEAACKLLTLPKIDLINRCFSRYIADDSQAIFSHYQRFIFNEMSCKSFQLKLLRWHGPTFYATLTCRAIYNEIEQKKFLLVSITDISETKSQEEFMHNQRVKISSIERLGALYELVANITQEQNHSLAMINNYIYGCIRRLQNENFNTVELLKGLNKASEHASLLYSITHRIKKITQRSRLHFEIFSINDVIKEVITLLSFETLDLTVKVYFDPLPNLPKVKIDKNHIQQVLLTFARNAIEAMLEAKTCGPKIIFETYLSPQNILEISVIDNGPGFHPSQANKLFDPHFTTKAYSLGLGLTQGLTIAKKHGGDLLITLNATVGVCSKIILPCVVSMNKIATQID